MERGRIKKRRAHWVHSTMELMRIHCSSISPRIPRAHKLKPGLLRKKKSHSRKQFIRHWPTCHRSVCLSRYNPTLPAHFFCKYLTLMFIFFLLPQITLIHHCQGMRFFGCRIKMILEMSENRWNFIVNVLLFYRMVLFG